MIKLNFKFIILRFWDCFCITPLHSSSSVFMMNKPPSCTIKHHQTRKLPNGQNGFPSSSSSSSCFFTSLKSYEVPHWRTIYMALFATPFSSLVRMHNFLFKIAELEIQLVCTETGTVFVIHALLTRCLNRAWSMILHSILQKSTEEACEGYCDMMAIFMHQKSDKNKTKIRWKCNEM